MTIPTIVTIAGSDPSGGAGIQADIKSISANGGFATSVIVALTAQNTQAVTGVHMVPEAFVIEQMRTLWADVHIDAVKVGMLGTSSMVSAVAGALKELNHAPVVVDPVCVAKSGDALLAKEAVETLVQELIPLADIITPNMPEAAWLLGEEERTEASEQDLEDLGQRLLALGPKAVLLKGGHLSGEDSSDVFIMPGEAHFLYAKRTPTKNTHGTGCTLSSALATHLPQSASPLEAVEKAKAYITKAIASADDLTIGQGHGPVHHFHAFYAKA